MTEERIQRRLTAILVADLVSYSRLADVDEKGMCATS
jgi:class 3 adenylate cyclase